MDHLMKLLFCFTFVLAARSDEKIRWSTSQDNLTHDHLDWNLILPRNVEPKGVNMTKQMADVLRIVGGDIVDVGDDLDGNTEAKDWNNILPRNHQGMAYNSTWSSQENNQRIYGGKVATPHSVPYQAALIVTTPGGHFFCGGSLISLLYVLTAAHCLEGAIEVEIILGAHKVQELEPTQQRFLSTIFKIHDRYNTVNLANDIGIIELPINATLNQYVQIVKLPSWIGSVNPNWVRTARLSGWGKLSSVADLSPELKIGYLTITPTTLCRLIFPSTSLLGNVCTFGYFMTSGCNGDSGGPLVVGNRQVGIVSFGAQSCELGFPTVFTRVAAHLQWIQSNTDVVVRTF